MSFRANGSQNHLLGQISRVNKKAFASMLLAFVLEDNTPLNCGGRCAGPNIKPMFCKSQHNSQSGVSACHEYEKNQQLYISIFHPVKDHKLVVQNPLH